MKRKTLRLLYVAAVAALGFCRVAQSDLRVDLRVTSVTGPATINNTQSVLVTGIGAQINMDIFARITGTNALIFDDGLTSLSGSLLSPSFPWSRMNGTISTSLVPGFLGNGSSVGLQADLDGDSDLDVGSNNDADAYNFFAVRATTAPNPVTGPEIKIGHATFTVNDITSAVVDSLLIFRPRDFGTAATWLEDGMGKTPNSPGTGFYFGQGVSVSAIPEPGPLGLLAAVTTFASALRPQRRK